MSDFSSIYADSTLSADTDTYNPATRLGTGGTARGYKTLNSAINAVSTGGTITVRAGTYSELGRVNVCYPIDKDMTIQAATGEMVTLTYPANNPPILSAGNYGPIVSVSANVSLVGFTIIGTRAEGDSASEDSDINILVSAFGNGTIRQCVFQQWSHAAIKWGNLAGELTVERCQFEAGGYTLFDHHIYAGSNTSTHRATIRHNAMTGSSGFAIHGYSAPQHIDAYGNVIYACGGGHEQIAEGWTRTEGGGIVIGGGDHRIYNNTVGDCLGLGGLVLWHGLNTSTLKNNILLNNAGYDLRQEGTDDEFTVLTVGYNNYATDNVSAAIWDDNGTDVNVNPMFVNETPATWIDYRLSAESPMIAAGDTSPFTLLLDPAQTAIPTPKTAADNPIGAFTT